jgi:hypothetical protein
LEHFEQKAVYLLAKNLPHQEHGLVQLTQQRLNMLLLVGVLVAVMPLMLQSLLAVVEVVALEGLGLGLDLL